MFFYVLYADKKVVGYAEFAYLTDNQILFIDYLATNPRNHTYFYTFYHLIVEDITTELNSKYQHVKYIVTELSLRERKQVLIDEDSNYFRQLLSAENFYLSKAPYFQPLLKYDTYESPQSFNLAIKPLSSSGEYLSKKTYIGFLKEIYYAHYLAWYEKFYSDSEVKKTMDKLWYEIEKECTENIVLESIAIVNCLLFSQGKCKQINVENITLSSMKRRKRFRLLKETIWFFLTVITFVMCCVPCTSDLITKICSFLTIIAGIISIIQFRR